VTGGKMLKKYIRIYIECIKISISTALTYRLNFLLDNFIMLVSNILFPLFTLLIYGSGAEFPNWSLYEVLLIQAVFTMSTGIANILFNGVLWATMRHIIEGSLEIVLIKPVDCLFFLTASTIEFSSIGLFLGGLVIFVVALPHIGPVSILMVLQFIVLFLSGVCVMMGISFIMAATSFKWVGNSRIPEIFESIKYFGRYPQNIFHKAISGFTSFIIPVAMVGYFPAASLLGKADATAFIAILPCFLFAMAGVFLFRHMIRLYEGVGG
jgi:ABC-2 type transport system permease protein